MMLDIIYDTIKDGLRILPFLWIAFLLIELFEHKFSRKSKRLIEKSGKFGPLLGGILGCFPQCGFSVMATNLYVTRIISMGTLISVYLSTSDEMLPIMISRGGDAEELFLILGIKVMIGVISGFLIDFIISKKNEVSIKDLCVEEECHCDKGILVSSFRHTFKSLFFIVIVSFVLNIVMFYGGEDVLSSILGGSSMVAPFIASLIGLVPNCSASVVITELYLNDVLSISSLISGLLTGGGVALLVLFKSNKNMHENVRILMLVYLIGVLSGLMIELVSSFI